MRSLVNKEPDWVVLDLDPDDEVRGGGGGQGAGGTVGGGWHHCNSDQGIITIMILLDLCYEDNRN